MQKSGKMNNILIEGTKELIEENGNKVDPIEVYAKTQHVFAEVKRNFTANFYMELFFRDLKCCCQIC